MFVIVINDDIKDYGRLKDDMTYKFLILLSKGKSCRSYFIGIVYLLWTNPDKYDNNY